MRGSIGDIMSEYTDSLKGDDDSRFKTFLLEQLSNAENRVSRGKETLDSAYWQGRKDAFRLALACYLNKPEITSSIATSTFREIALKNRS